MIWGAIIVAAGRGTRFGRPKQLVELAGEPLVSWSMRTLAQMPEIADVVVVTEEDWLERMRSIAAEAAHGKCAAVVAGGATRQRSVAAGLAALPQRCEGVLVHDGARPMLDAKDVRSGMNAVRGGRGAVLGVRVVDTIKVVDAQDGHVVQTLDRQTLWAAQTPQFATVRDLRRAHEDAARSGVDMTDDAALLERAGVEVRVVEGSPENFKVTLPEDLERAEALMRRRTEGAACE